jgi:TetR/AcrR family transcriptional regulator, fatty acid biosynthesis regulator
MTGTARPLTSRQIAKEQTRQRLLDAALDILDRDGEAGLTTTRVAQRAGVAQPTFYVHFEDMDDLLRTLVHRLWAERRTEARPTRDTVRRATTQAAIRALFRTTVASLVAHPAVLRLVVRSRLDPSSPLGDDTRAEYELTVANLSATLAATGVPHTTPEDRRRLRMRADALMAAVETLALGHIEGRYDDIEDVLDVLMGVARGLTLNRSGVSHRQ